MAFGGSSRGSQPAPCRLTGALMAAVAVTAGVVSALAKPEAPAAAKRPYRSPFEVAYSPDGKALAVTDHTAAAVVLIDVGEAKVTGEINLRGRPAGLAWEPNGEHLFVAECGAGSVAEVDPVAGKVTRRSVVGPRPVGVAVTPTRRLLLAANSATNTVSVVDRVTGKEKARIAGPYAPYFLAITPDEELAAVGSLLPATPASDPATSAAIALLDLNAMKVAAEVRLPPNASLIRQIAISPDGKWAYAVHTLGRTTLPTTQLDRGWINTNALSIIDLAEQRHLATVLLDQVTEGAADPWGAAVSKDGQTLWVSLAGVHQIARLDLIGLHKLLEGDSPTGAVAKQPNEGSYSDVWLGPGTSPSAWGLLANDLAALYRAGLLKRMRIEGRGPRGISLSPDGGQWAAAAYYSGSVVLGDTGTGTVTKALAVGQSPEPDLVRRGETIFHDATYCFQHWLSCATCHPDGRADGLNWDLLNDGIGNPKNVRSLLLAHKTPPLMSRGVRASMEEAVAAGFRHILFRKPAQEDIEAVVAFLRAMEPDRSPHLLPNGKLSAQAKRGKVIFGSSKAACAKCHPAPLFTDRKMYDVGSRGPLDRADEFDTPTLVELWRTPPYLHDGQARNLHEVLRAHNSEDRHGNTSHLSEEDLDALVEYLLSL